MSSVEKGEGGPCCGRVNKELLPNKLVYMSFGSGYGAIQPYLTLYFKQLWLSTSAAGILFGSHHIWRILTGWMLCAIADKYQKRKTILFLGMLISGVAFLFLNFAPPNTANKVCPTNSTTLSGKEVSDVPQIAHGHSLFSSTFIYLFLFISVGSFFASANDPIADAMTLKSLDGDADKIGYQRCLGGLGYGLAAFLVGGALALQETSTDCEEGTELDYRLALYVGGSIWVLGSISVYFMKDSPDPVATHSVFEFLGRVRESMNLKIGAVIFIGVYCGAMKSIIDSFLFWRLKEIGGVQIINSLIKGVQSVSEFVGFLTAEFCIKKLGHFGVIFLALLFYAIQLLVYILISNPWLALLTEWMPMVTFAMFLTSGISYIGLCPGVAATMQALFSNAFLGLGFFLGPTVAGPLIDTFGLTEVFGGCCTLTVIVLILFILVVKVIGDDGNVNAAGYKEVIDMEEEE